jgi:iron(II)-dependent oxidoreductase
LSRAALIEELAHSQSLLLGVVENLDEISLRSQYHPDLSPLGWHLGHCVYTECLWLHEKIRGDASVTTPIADFYTPPKTPKSERGRLLPAKSDLLAWAADLQQFNLHFLRRLRPELQRHPLFEGDYILHFLIQHNSQHYETMLMVLNQKAISAQPHVVAGSASLRPAPLRNDTAEIPTGHYRVGGAAPAAYDNELPVQRAELGHFAIGRFPVSNAEYLAFMEDGGYRRAELWSEAGWQWRQRERIEHPDHWRLGGDRSWYGTGVRGDYQLAADQPVCGISHYEAQACARWAGAELPHEYQWEVACRIGALQQTGRVWEWCDNTFHPYEGFQPFPYREYSQPWFDERHFSLRGGSLHTRPSLKRASFRNFFQPDKRHVFAGLRLAFRPA